MNIFACGSSPLGGRNFLVDAFSGSGSEANPLTVIQREISAGYGSPRHARALTIRILMFVNRIQHLQSNLLNVQKVSSQDVHILMI